jgi:hypothetical protein
MTNKEYHEDLSAVSKSALDLIHKAPALYNHFYLQKNKRERTKYFNIGSAFHCLVLEPHKFSEQVVVHSRFANRDTRNKFMDENDHLIPLSLDEYKIVLSMKESLEKHPISKYLQLQDLVVEHVLFWINKETGVKCKIRFDAVNLSKRMVIDLKSTDDASDNGFRRSARKYRYHVQSPFYLEGLNANEWDVDTFIFVAVETKPPFLVNCFFADGETLANGREEYLQDLEKYKKSILTKNWNGYDLEIKPLNVY